ncbi:uncharacterized protein hdly [Planococcus citri]|uniref:uncharacterized protein hdly n=1 Tax=Planococcus citri TaxID=170843 RepID=UPI0031F90B1B
MREIFRLLFLQLISSFVSNRHFVLCERWQTSASFSKHNSFDKNTKMYNKPSPPVAPLPFQNAYANYDDSEKRMRNYFEPDQQPYNPYPDYFYPPVNIPHHPANDVLVIVLEQNMKCGNETEQKQPPQSTPRVFPPPSRCIWAIVACCAPTSVTFRYSCFNFLGCSGTFWQINPCQLPIIMLAANEASEYYKQFEPQPTASPPAPTETPANANTTEVPTPETTTAAASTAATNVETTTVNAT